MCLGGFLWPLFVAGPSIGKKRIVPEVLEDDEMNVHQYVEEELGNLAIAVSLFKKALVGLDCAQAAKVMQQFRSAPVDSLGQQSVERHLRGMSKLIRRVTGLCCGNIQLESNVMALLGIVAVLDPAGVLSAVFLEGGKLRMTRSECMARLKTMIENNPRRLSMQ